MQQPLAASDPEHGSEARIWFVRGARDILPVLIGVLPFATIAGAATAAVGATPAQSFGLSAFVFAGTAEIASLELYGNNTPAMVIIVTAIIINLRFAMYSASLSNHFRGLTRRFRSALTYVLTDQAYAVSMVRLVDLPSAQERGWYYFGTALPMWMSWQVGHAAGYFLGASVPPEWSLEFTIPLALMAIMIPALEDRIVRWVALATALAVPLTSLLPFGLGMIGAIAAGVAAGALLDRWSR